MTTPGDQLGGALERLRDRLIGGEFRDTPREELTRMALDLSVCPVHFVDYAICFDDDDPACRQVRAIHPAYDS